MLENFLCSELFDMDQTIASFLLKRCRYPWEVLPGIHEFILYWAENLPEGYREIGDRIWAADNVKIAPTADITGPAILCRDAEIRHCAFLRGNMIVGEGAVVGNSTELKNVILFNKVQVPHYNYVGDSILGYRAHMGAGSITSNVKSDKTPVEIIDETGIRHATGLKKFGAVLGDFVEVGCGSVLNPGTVIGKNSNIYPLSSVRGYVPACSIYKKQGEIAEKRV